MEKAPPCDRRSPGASSTPRPRTAAPGSRRAGDDVLSGDAIEPEASREAGGPNTSPSFAGVPSAPTEEQVRAGEKPPLFAALRHRNFRLFWFGNVISLVGTLAQGTAQGWLVRLLTNDPQTIAGVAACNTIPIALLTIYAGVVADRVDKRRALIVTNSAAALLAVVLAGLVYWHLIQVWHIAILSLLTGVVNAFDIPVRQSYNVEMVGRDDLPNAIALNSTAFNGARVVGPAVGGFLMATVGMEGCFLVNACSFLALIGGLLLQHLPPYVAEPKGSPRFELPEGLAFVWHHPTLRLVTMLVGFVSLSAMSFSTILPVFARDVFHTNEHGFSVLLTCNGLGALGAAFTLALTGKMRHRGKRLLLGALLYCISVMAFAAAPNLTIACGVLIVSGWFLLTFLMTANTLVQTLAPDALRGRVFSLYSFALIGSTPLGAFLIGALAKAWGARQAVECGAGLATMFVLAVYLRFRELWKEK